MKSCNVFLAMLAAIAPMFAGILFIEYIRLYHPSVTLQIFISCIGFAVVFVFYGVFLGVFKDLGAFTDDEDSD